MIIVHTHSYCLFIIEYLLCIKITTKQFWQTHGFKRLKNDFQYIFCDKDEVNFVYNYIYGRFSVAKLSMFYKIAVWFVYVDIYHETFYKLYVYILYKLIYSIYPSWAFVITVVFIHLRSVQISYSKLEKKTKRLDIRRKLNQ